MSQQYSLRWNNHQPNFISMFTTLLNTQTLVDVTLAAEGKQLLAHKVVLSACSTYFQALFIDNPSRHPIVILKDVTFADLRTMVDFMYYGEVNVTEEQLPQVLITAKLLKIKGLTEMPEPASMTRSHTSTDFTSTGGDSMESQRHSTSPGASPSPRRKRRRKSSTGSTHLNMVTEAENREDVGQSVELVRDAASITLSSVPQQRRRDYLDERLDNTQQTAESHNLNIVEPLAMDANPAGMPQESSSSQSLKHRRSKFFKRQSRVPPEDREPRKQTSDPGPATSSPQLQKHGSYPQYTPPKNRRSRTQDQEVGSLLIRAVTVINRQSSTSTCASTSTSTDTQPDAAHAQRASHTPAVRSGPPLSCNFCWNTVDECGRILRRKTQYHCPECRTNLCIVPCFHEYHDGPESEASTTASAR